MEFSIINTLKTMKNSSLAHVCLWAVLAILCCVPASNAAELTVCADNCTYTCIQDAIDKAGQNDTVRVKAGRYTETLFIGDYWIIPPNGGPLSVNPSPKGLTHVVRLMGAHADEYTSGTSDRGHESVIVGQIFVNTRGNGVEINGFTIDSSTVTPYQDENNRIAKSALMIAGGPSATITCNIVKNAQRFGIRNGYVNGEAHDAIIINNTIINARDAAILNHVGNNNVQIIGNDIISSDGDGILCLKYETFFSENTLIQNNRIDGGHKGIVVDSGGQANIVANRIENTTSFAILTQSESVVAGNTVTHCKDGIRSEYPGTGPSDRVEITGNTISNIDYSGINVCGTHTLVSDNELQECNIKGENDNTPDYDYASIHVEAQNIDASHSIIQNNTIINGGNGIQVWADYVTVSGNTLTSDSYGVTKLVNDRVYINSPIVIGSNFGNPEKDFDPIGLVIHQPNTTIFYSNDLNTPPQIQTISPHHHLIAPSTSLDNLQFTLSDPEQTTITFSLQTSESDLITIVSVEASTPITQLDDTQYQVALESNQTTITLDITTQPDIYESVSISCIANDGSQTFKAESQAQLFTISLISKPELSNIPGQTIAEGNNFTPFSLDVFISDADHGYTEIIWSAAGQSDLSVTIKDRIVTISPPDNNWNGAETITFTATDPDGLSASDTSVFSVSPINDTPNFTPIPVQTVAEGNSFTNINLTLYASDIEDTQLAWTIQGLNNLEISVANGIASITITNENWFGTENIYFIATDSGGLTANQMVQFVVTNVNDAPVISDIKNQTIDEGNLFKTIILKAEDVDDSDISWTYSGNSKLQVSLNNNVASVFPTSSDWYGTETITFTAQDDENASDSQSVIFTVNPVNDPPKMLSIPDQTIDEDHPLTITLNQYVTDIDNDPSEMSWSTSVQDKLQVSITHGIATITNIIENWNGTETITFTATDPGNLTAYTAVLFTVRPINDPPVVSDIGNQEVNEGGAFATIKLDFFVQDVENEDSQITWTFSGAQQLSVTIQDREASIVIPNQDWSGSETITFTATDIEGLTDSDSASFKVTPVNDAPVISTIPGQTIDEGSAFLPLSLNQYISDIDNELSDINWSAITQNNLQVSITDDSATIKSKDENWSGTETITFIAKDPGGLTAYTPVFFTVRPINDPPVVSDIKNQEINEGLSFNNINLNGYVEDIDNDDSQIIWTVSGAQELNVIIQNRIASIVIPDKEWSGSETITFTAKDSEGLTDSDSATFKVNPVNDAPVILSIPEQITDEGSQFPTIELSQYVSDADNDLSDISWSAKAQDNLQVSITDDIATITINNENWYGTETITFTANDPGGLTAYTAVSFTVRPVNDPPVVSDIGNQEINEGNSFNTIHLDSYVQDIDDDFSQITWTFSGMQELDVSIHNGIASIVIPDINWSGTETITFTATDSKGFTDSDSATFQVNPVNDAPVILTIPKQTTDEGTPFSTIPLNQYISDVDNDISDIHWSATSQNNLQVYITDNIATITIKNQNWSGTETMTFTATDPLGLSDNAIVSFTVRPVNDPPVVSNIGNQEINEGESFATIHLDNHVHDIDNETSQISWMFSGAQELSVTIQNRIASIVIPDEDWYGTETITFTATDSQGLTDSDSVIFQVNPVNDAPVISSIPEQTTDEGVAFSTISLNQYISDIDNELSEIQWSAITQDQMQVSITDDTATITMNNENWFGSETITFIASDPGGLTAYTAVLFTVRPVNDPPIVSDIDDQTIDEGSQFSTIPLNAFVSDLDNENTDISWTPSGQTDLVVDIQNNIATITVPDENWNGSETITFTATDTEGLTDSDSVIFQVNPVNDAPVISSIPEQTTDEGVAFSTISLNQYIS
ncbi:MAG: hypothetical protein OMM_07858, partial [Candidatus Magnetoglobus multicellularis str. Araruama]